MKTIIQILIILISSNSLAQSSFDEVKNCELDSLNGMKVFQIVENPPQFEGGSTNFYRVLAKNLKIPLQPDSLDLKSKFYISFVIDTLGNIKNFCATDIMEEVIDDDLIKKINYWEPGTHRGQKVPVRMLLPISICYRK